MSTNEPQEPDYLTWSPSKPAEPTPPTAEEATTEQSVDAAVPDSYMPPTTDGTGFVEAHSLYKQPRSFSEISFDISGLSGDQRRLLSFRLAELNVAHHVDGDALTTGTESATAVQGQLDALVAPEEAPSVPEEQSEPEVGEPAHVADVEVDLPSEDGPLLVAEALEPQEPEEEVAEWVHPAPVETVAVVDEPVVERTEPEEITVEESTDVDEVIDAADDDEDEIVFDLASLSTEERRHLSMRLTGAGIAHIWEVATDLVVSVKDAPLIESYLDEVRNPHGFADDELDAFESDEDVDDEAVYAAMSALYVAADKLMQRPGDPSAQTAFYNSVDDVDGLPAPFGFDPRVWSQVQELSNSIADAMDNGADDDTVASDARTLRQLMVNYV